MIIHLDMDQDNNSNSSSIIREGTIQVTRHIHHPMVIRAVEVVVAVAVVVVEVVVSIQVIINRVLAEGMGSHRVAMEDSRVVMATKGMEVCIK